MAGGVKNPPAMPETQETQVRSLGWEDPLEKENKMKISECTAYFSFLITDLHHLGQNYKDAQGLGNAQ